MNTVISDLVSYDIPDDKQRTKLAKTIKDFGDRVRIYCLCANCEKEIRIMGKGKVTKE